MTPRGAGLAAVGMLAASPFAAAGAAADPSAACLAASESRVAASACLELRARAAAGDLAAATVAARDAAERLAEATGRDAAVDALAASEAAFAAYLAAECDRRRAVMDAGTGAGDADLACRAELRTRRAERLWGEVDGRPIAADAITSRAWRLVRLDGDAVLAGTAPDLTLGEDDRAGGDASTNRWFAPYHVAGMGIAFGTTGTTMMFNDEPAGRMAQERRYLELLREVNRWRLDDGRLALLADDTPRLDFE
ncbi:MAG: META domain-containing protein [Alphaproteobacteria bacterium]|nr:META domain-containing protein [Alphaproteobacteria bacterium]